MHIVCTSTHATNVFSIKHNNVEIKKYTISGNQQENIINQVKKKKINNLKFKFY
jgi:hypothetical protein